MKRNTKLIVLLLSLALIIGSVAVIASADNNVASIGDAKYETLDAALAAAKAGDTVKLLADATLAASFSVKQNLTIDLGGHALSSAHQSAFTVDADVSFSIVGEGSINLDGSLITSESTPDVTVKSEGKPIVITHTGTAAKNLITGSYGNWYFSNITATVVVNGSNSAAFQMSDSANSNAKFHLEGVTVNSNKQTGQYEYIVRILANGSAVLDYCYFNASGCVIGLASSAYTGDILTVNNSYLYGNRGYGKGEAANQTGVIGTYAKISGKVNINDSVIKGSYRPILLKPEATGLITLNNSSLIHNGTNGNSVSRSGRILVKSGSVLGHAKDGASSIISSTDCGYLMLEEGARLDSYAYNAFNNSALGVKFVVKTTAEDGTVTEALVDPADCATLSFAYDPVGNASAPYVLTSNAAGLGVDAIPGKGIYSGGADLPSGTFWTDGTYSTETADLLVPSAVWNPSGTFYTATLDGQNKVLKYTKTATSADATKPEIIFGSRNGSATLQSNADVVIFSFDLATDSSIGFTPMNLSLHSRSNNTNNGGSGRQRSFGSVSASGLFKPSFSNGKNTSEYQLSTNGWNRFSIVVDTSVETTGRMYVYINGTFVGSGDAYSADDAYIFGPRFSINSSATKNYTFLIDNLLLQTIGTGSGETDVSSPESFLVKGGKAWNFGYVNYSFAHTVQIGKFGITDINDIISGTDKDGYKYATAIPMINAAFTNPTPIATDIRINANGKAFNFPTSSNSFAKDGSIYEFDHAYASETATFKWFVGNINNPKDLSNESKWITVTLASGNIPTASAPDNSITPLLASAGYEYKFAKHNGWSSEALDLGAHFDVGFVRANPTVTVMPTFNESSLSNLGYKYVVLDKDGCFKKGGSTTNFYGSDWTTRKNSAGEYTAVRLEYGETFVLVSNDITFIGAFSSPYRGTESDNKSFSFDFNGHTATFNAQKNSSGKYGNYFTANEGETFNFYSSLPGAKINCLGLKNDSSTIATGGNFITVS